MQTKFNSPLKLILYIYIFNFFKQNYFFNENSNSITFITNVCQCCIDKNSTPPPSGSEKNQPLPWLKNDSIPHFTPASIKQLLPHKGPYKNVNIFRQKHNSWRLFFWQTTFASYDRHKYLGGGGGGVIKLKLKHKNFKNILFVIIELSLYIFGQHLKSTYKACLQNNENHTPPYTNLNVFNWDYSMSLSLHNILVLTPMNLSPKCIYSKWMASMCKLSECLLCQIGEDKCAFRVEC